MQPSVAGSILRVFPRRTTATPDDPLVVVGKPPTKKTLLGVPAFDCVEVSCTFSWDMPKAEELYRKWSVVAPAKIGGPAFSSPVDEFTPGKYLRPGYVITSRGCPNACWFCQAWRKEGRVVRELEVHDGWNLLDNNILATSQGHQRRVFEMLSRQKHRVRFTGGLEAARLTPWAAEQIVRLRPDSAFFAYDEPKDWEPLREAAEMMISAGASGRWMRCFVLIGYQGDTIPAARDRLEEVCRLGLLPMAMLFNRDGGMEWKQFQRVWAAPVSVGAKFSAIRRGESSDKPA